MNTTVSGQPPLNVSLKWCRVCGRTDRHAALRARHFAFGRMCEGTPETVVYTHQAAAPGRCQCGQDGCSDA